MAADSDENKRSPLKAWVRALERTAPIGRDPPLTLPVLIAASRASASPTRPRSLGGGSVLSYRELAAACNRYARWGTRAGAAARRVVALFMAQLPGVSGHLARPHAASA